MRWRRDGARLWTATGPWGLVVNGPRPPPADPLFRWYLWRVPGDGGFHFKGTLHLVSTGASPAQSDAMAAVL